MGEYEVGIFVAQSETLEIGITGHTREKICSGYLENMFGIVIRLVYFTSAKKSRILFFPPSTPDLKMWSPNKAGTQIHCLYLIQSWWYRKIVKG